ncbi:Dyp-type peroxidase [Amycolatopsis sp. NPDC051045]|uniref:Dyp-type peroxidase n=1 Tax=Amycolatopsis sp. NPDC051045 TaxID=3156922 RepID=UPI003415BA1F
MTVGRRAFLAAVGAFGLAGCAPTAEPPRRAAGPRQPGVVTPAPPRIELAAFDVTARDREGLAAILRALSEPAPGVTLTVAVGASLFDGRFGIERPRLLTPMPPFRSDVLDPEWCHGDLLVQAGAATAEPIERALGAKIPGLVPRWRQAGFHPDGPVRNLFGFREGAGNPDASDTALMDRLVWVQPGDDEPAWCAGGTYQVVRLIRLATPTWNSKPVPDQERVFGRAKESGAPLGRQREQEIPDYAGDPRGEVIALDAHIRRANPRTPESEAHRILRRGYSSGDGEGRAGHLFICFQRDVERGFATIQKRLAGESLERYILPFGGGYYFVLPGGTGGGDHIGKTMLG